MHNIFIPMMGRINTQNRDGGEIRISKFINWLAGKYNIEILCPERQLLVLKDQDVSTTKIKTKILFDLLRSESDSLANVLLTYFFRLATSLFVKYPQDIDVIYSPSDFLFDVIPSILCKLRNKKAILCICVFLICPNPFRGFSRIGKSKYSFPSIRQTVYYISQSISLYIAKIFHAKIFVLNQIDFEKLKNKSFNVRLLTMGVDTAEYAAVEAQDVVYDAVYFGRLHKQKGLERLLKSWEIVCKKQPRRLCIIGGGADDYKQHLVQLARKLGIIDLVEFVGFKRGEEKIKLIKSSRIAVIPSTYESFGMTMIEAGLCEIPVVAFNIPVFNELFGNYINLVANDDLEEYAAHINKFLDCFNEPNDMFVSYCRSLDWNIVFRNDMEFIHE